MTIRTPLLVLFLLLTPAVVGGHNWQKMVQQVDYSIVRISYALPSEYIAQYGLPEGARSTCTGFSINRQHGYFLTAYHCLNNGTVEGLEVDGESAHLMWANIDLDAAALSARVSRPALRVNSHIEKGMPIGVLGFGYALADTLFVSGFVAHPSIQFGPSQPGQWLIMDSAFIGGMSGAPVFDDRGRVIALVQRGNDSIGWGRPIADIYKATRIYWQ